MTWHPVLINAAASLLTALVVLIITFAIGAAKNRHRVVDIAWGIGFSAVALTSLVLSQGHGDPIQRWTVTVLTVAWGLRLAIHIGIRSRGHGEDPRYEELLSKAPGNRTLYAFRMVYLLQAVLLWFISLPIQIAQYDDSPVSFWLVAGFAVWGLGMFFETVGDQQLAVFRRDPANRGKVLDSGLWRYSRHPNYFGDAGVWWGLYLLACSSWAGAATVLSPLAMTYFLVGKTGKPLMDEHLRSTRSGYVDYIRRTSGFVPLPPKS